MIEINKNYNESNLVTLNKTPDNTIDLTITSPPYDDLRAYNGFELDWQNLIRELYRTTKQGGVVVWVVGDATIKGNETGTSFKQALFAKECGFNLHDTMIYQKSTPPLTHNRYEQNFEYMFVFSKGKPNTFNPIMVVSEHYGKKVSKNAGMRNTDGTKKERYHTKSVNKLKIKGNIWYLPRSSRSGDKFSRKHPATFPEQLANDHIISWSNEGDLVYDPFMGSGTTAKMAMLNNRNYIGSEISKEYCEIAEKRIKMCGGLFSNSFETELSNEAGT